MDPPASEVAVPGWAEVVGPDPQGHHAVRSRAAFARGDVLARFAAARLVATPGRHTLQIDGARHLEPAPAFLVYVNHGCDPNVAFDLAAFHLVALRPIAPGDELRCFYPATEWELAEPFACRCGSPRCLGEVRGARELTDEQLARAPISPYVERQRAAPGGAG